MESEFVARFNDWQERVGRVRAVGLTLVLPSLIFFALFLALTGVTASEEFDPFPGRSLQIVLALFVVCAVACTPRAIASLASFLRHMATTRHIRGHVSSWQLKPRLSISTIIFSALQLYIFVAVLLTLVGFALAEIAPGAMATVVPPSWWLVAVIRLCVLSFALGLARRTMLEIATVGRQIRERQRFILPPAKP